MFSDSRKFGLVGAAFGLAAAAPGNELAPQVLREGGLVKLLNEIGIDLSDYGDIPQPQPASAGDPKAKYLAQTSSFCRELYLRTLNVYQDGRRSVVIGGDHSISIGSVSAASTFLRSKFGAEAKLGLLWVDAHPDINTPQTSPSGNIHGMSLASLLGMGPSELTSLSPHGPALEASNIVMLGLRDVDPPERDLLKRLAIKTFTMTELDLMGAGRAFTEALKYIEDRCEAFVLSFDLDVCEPEVAPGVGTPVRGGLTIRESHLLMELANMSSKILGVELVEFNPALDYDHHTRQFALWLLQSALGKKIL